MAPKVCVPADFGKHHIGAASHGNLTFTLQEGVKIKANSIILSLNSPVIDELTTKLHQTSLEADDFSSEAVDCFIEAAYTGEVEALKRENFRDVNKMGAVFKVSWLSARCKEYFESHLSEINNGSSYSDVAFVVEESIYVMSALKNQEFYNLVVKKVSSFDYLARDAFIFDYLSELPKSNFRQIDFCLAIANIDVQILVELLSEHLEQEDCVCFDEMSRYLFKNLDMGLCYENAPGTHKKLLEVLGNLENIEKDDYILVLEKLEKTTVQNKSVQLGETTSGTSTSTQCDMCDLKTFTLASFSQYLVPASLDDVIDMLAATEIVDNLYQFIDGIWLRLCQCRKDTVNISVIQKIVGIKRAKGWKPINYDYLDRLLVPQNALNCSDFKYHLKSIGGLVIKNTAISWGSTNQLYGGDFVEDIYKSDKDFLFKINNPTLSGVRFVLSITSMKNENPDTFSIKWTVFSKTNVNYPSNLKLHFALERWNGSSWTLFPISWSGKPTCDQTKRHWAWGYFYSKSYPDRLIKLMKGKEKLSFSESKAYICHEYRYRFVAFVV